MVELYVKLNPTKTVWKDQVYVGSQFNRSNALPPTYDNLKSTRNSKIEHILTDNDDLNDDEDYNMESEENTDSADDEAKEDEEFYKVDEERYWSEH
jgi:hypothetical protein